MRSCLETVILLDLITGKKWRNTNFREALSVCVLVMVAQGGEGGETDAPPKKHESGVSPTLDNGIQLLQGTTTATEAD